MRPHGGKDGKFRKQSALEAPKTIAPPGPRLQCF
jgi:hypothetical protein